MHGGRIAYYVIGDGIVPEPDYLSPAGGGCPFAAAAAPAAAAPAAAAPAAAARAAAAAAPAADVMGSPFKFGRLFDKADIKCQDRRVIADCLTALGEYMNDPSKNGGEAAPGFSDIPSGYTYLGQFIAHEITSDGTKGLPLEELLPANLRSPSFDLDSLYGKGPGGTVSDDDFYEKANRARLKVGPTQETKAGINRPFDNDLPRKEDGEALIADERNDQNLAVAQMHVALIKFHNRVVADLEDKYRKKSQPLPSAEKLFEEARAEVVKHFQWIVLHDYLEKIVDDGVRKAVLGGDLRLERLKAAGEGELFMPVEFSAAAFRIGHSMVRPNYQWNTLQSNELGFGPAMLGQLFSQTHFSNQPGSFRKLPSDWIIDWRRFFDFRPLGYGKNLPSLNMAGRIDTVFDLHPEKISGFNHQGLLNSQRFITVRNLLRGLAFSLQSGEFVAHELGEDVLEPDELGKGDLAARLNAAPIRGKTPLWYYILREAKERGTAGKLGRVGSRIVAETLYSLIRNSNTSILIDKDWLPAYRRPEAGGAKPEEGGVKPEAGSVKFEMVDLLHAAGVVDPIGAHMKQIYKH